MKGLWSRGTPGIHLDSMLLLVTTLLISSTIHSQPVRCATLPAPATVLLVQLGEQVSFNCTNASAYQLVWYDGTLLLNSTQFLHGVMITGVSNNVTISIPNVTSYHYGNYKCFNDETGQIQATVTLMPSTTAVSTPLDLITEKLIEQRADNVVISCDGGDLLVKVDQEFHHVVIPDDVLVVNLSEHQGKYLCLGENNYPSMVCYVQLSGYHPLNITISPRGIHQVYPYQNIDCLVTGAPDPLTINWYYNTTEGQPISADGRIYVEHIYNITGYDNGLRLILDSSFPVYDSGVYLCVAKTDWEQVEQSLDINFVIGSDVYIAYWPRNTLAVGGSTIYITCYAVSKLYTDITFTFTKDNHTLPPEVSSSSIRFADYVISSSLILYNVTPSDDGVYGCQLLHIVKTDLRNGSLLVYKDPLHVVSFIFNKSADNNISLMCDVTIHEDFSDRLSDIIVVFKLDNHTVAPTLTFTASNNVSAAAIVMDSGLYHCIATIDGVSKSLSVYIKGSAGSKDGAKLKNILLYGLAVVGFLCVVMFTLLFLICCRCPQRSRNAGYSSMVSKTKIGARLSTTSCASAEFVFKKSSSSSSLLASSEWTIPYDALQFDCSLGSGAFGTVRKAYMMTGIGHRTPVAVKSLQCGDDEVSSREAFEKEVMILHHVGSHQHIIGLFGVCLQANRCLLVMELASQGSLLDYVRHKRTDKLQPLSIQEVLKFAKQIALGMEHLANQQCVHCDLAARNVLITGDFILKISDFGLARKLYSGVYVKDKSKKVLLPIRWMAPESMTELKFSSQSDIWSYGVVLWEMYQLGAVPYQGLPTHKLCSLLQQGLRLEKPQNCTEHNYQLMLSCWHDDPCHRPSFTDIVQELSQFVTITPTVYINWDADADYYSDSSVASSDEDCCPVHGKSSTGRNHPAVKRNICLKRMDSGLPDSPNDPFACKKELQCNKSVESDV